MSDDLESRVHAFRALELPGQPQMMHMGSAELVSDLWAEVKRLREEGANVARAQIIRARSGQMPVEAPPVKHPMFEPQAVGFNSDVHVPAQLSALDSMIRSGLAKAASLEALKALTARVKAIEDQLFALADRD